MSNEDNKPLPKKTIAAVAIILVLMGTFLFWRSVIDGGNLGPPTVSREVTFVTDQKYATVDGYIDYVRAINDFRRAHITPEENACVDLFRAFGPLDEPHADWQARWKRMTRDPEPMGPFLTSFNWDDPTWQAIERPWADDEFPKLIQWFENNVEPARHLANAVTRNDYYYPFYVENEDQVAFGVLLPLISQAREAARFLTARAMNHLANDRIDECITDLLAVRALGSLISQHGIMIEHLVGVAVQGVASEGERQLIASQKMTSAQIDDYLRRFDQLLPFNDLVESLDKIERLACLDAIQYTGRSGFAGGDVIGLGEVPILGARFDMDVPMKMMNEQFDLMTIAIGPGADAERAFNEHVDFVNQLENGDESFWDKLRLRLGGSKTRGEAVGKVMVGFLLPAITQVQNAELRRQALEQMTQLSLHIERYRLATGEYPDSLTDLKLADTTVTFDPFVNKPLVYQKTTNGFKVYSVGANGQDDNGANSFNFDEKESGDDWRFEIGESKTK